MRSHSLVIFAEPQEVRRRKILQEQRVGLMQAPTTQMGVTDRASVQSLSGSGHSGMNVHDVRCLGSAVCFGHQCLSHIGPLHVVRQL